MKELVRSRMARTGESYMTARAQLARRARGRVRSGPAIVVPVGDIDRARLFYSNALMLPVRSAASTWTIVGNDEGTLALEPGGVVGTELGIGLRVTDLDHTLERVVAEGGAVLDRTGPAARIADPDGNVLRLLSMPTTPGD